MAQYRLASRVGRIDSSGIRKIFDLARSLKDPINLSIGQPDFDVPPEIKYEAIDFGVMIEKMVGQTFDIAVIGWTGTGTDPNDETLWKAEFDTPGSGLNFVSYYNPKVEELMEKGVTAAGCTPEVRAPFYKEIQKLMHDDVAYVFVSGGVGNTAYAKRWGGIDPGTWSFFYNIQQWYFKQ